VEGREGTGSAAGRTERTGMARAIWTGVITFGLVTVPVGLFSATQDHTVHFHQLQRGTSDRIRNRRVNQRTGEEVGTGDIVKGYELAEGEYVVVEPDELDEIAPGRSQTVDITDFVDLDEIEPVYFDRTYYVAPRGKEYLKVYQLLRTALAEANMAGVATFVMRNKQYLTALRAEKDILVLQTPHWADEVRDPVKELPELPSAGRTGARNSTWRCNWSTRSAAPGSPAATTTRTRRRSVTSCGRRPRARRSPSPRSRPRPPTSSTSWTSSRAAWNARRAAAGRHRHRHLPSGRRPLPLRQGGVEVGGAARAEQGGALPPGHRTGRPRTLEDDPQRTHRRPRRHRTGPEEAHCGLSAPCGPGWPPCVVRRGVAGRGGPRASGGTWR